MSKHTFRDPFSNETMTDGGFCTTCGRPFSAASEPCELAAPKPPGFFSPERVKARWKRVFSFLWPLIEDTVKEAVTREVEDRLGGRDDGPERRPHRPAKFPKITK